MITGTTSVVYGDRFYIPWFLLNKSTNWSMNFMILFFELVEKIYLSGFQEMFFMFFVLISCYSSSHHRPCSWWNTRIVLPIFIYYFFNISPSLYLYGFLQIALQQASSSFTSIFNRNFWCLCKVFREVPSSHAIDFTKRFSWVLDETISICIPLRTIETYLFRSLNWLYSTTHIFYHIFLHFFFLCLIFEYPIVS